MPRDAFYPRSLPLPPLSVIITAFREAETIGQAIEAFLTQLPEQAELIVVCPDPETTAVVDSYAAREAAPNLRKGRAGNVAAAAAPAVENVSPAAPRGAPSSRRQGGAAAPRGAPSSRRQGGAAAQAPVRHVADPQHGKPTAVNAGLAEAKGEIVVLSDGDVLVDEQALKPLLTPFADPQVGAVTGHPISVNARDTLLGYWSHLLTDGIHRMRQARHQRGEFLLCSGYLFAFRRELIETVPEDALAEDAVISHRIAQQTCGSEACRTQPKKGKRSGIRYAPEAYVYVRYPTTYSDWLRQKVRSAGGYAQKYVRKSPVRMRSAWLELKTGARMALGYPRNSREFLWTLLLFAARLHLWLLVLIKVRLLQRPLDRLWKRVESTK